MRRTRLLCLTVLATLALGLHAATAQDTAIAYGDSLSGAIATPGAANDYLFTGSEGDVIDIAVNSDASDPMDPRVWLYYNGILIASDDDGGAGLNSLLDNFVLPESGTYVIRVTAFSSSSTGSYAVSLTQDFDAVYLLGELSAGDNPGFLNEGDIDLHPLSLSATSEVQIDLTSSDFDTYLSIYAGSTRADRVFDNLIETDDDGGDGLNSQIIRVLPPGDYLVEAYSFSGSGEGDYNIALSVVAEEQPASLAYGDVLQGQINPAGDVDDFLFVGSAGDVVDISLSSSDMDAYLELYYRGRLIASDDDGGGSLNSLIDDFVLPESGSYIVRAHELGDNSTGTYTLGLSASFPFVLFTEVTDGAYSGTLAEAGDIHLYPYSLSEGAAVSIDLSSPDFDTYLVLYGGSDLSDRSDANYVSSNDDGGEGLNSLLETELPAGDYLVEVRGFSSSATGDYTLVLSAGDADDEDTLGPVAITYGEETYGVIGEPGDTDDFSFTGTAGDVVSISQTSQDMDSVLELYLDGELIAYNDDGGDGLNSLISNFVLPTSGTYVIRAREFGDNDTGTYTLRLTFGEIVVLDGLGVPDAAAGTISNPGQVHLYPLDLSSATRVQIDLESPDFDTYLTVYSGDGIEDRSFDNWVAGNDDGGTGLNSQLVLSLEAGSYLVEARPLSWTSTGSYTLALAAPDDTGGSIAYGESIDGELSVPGEIDLYSFVGSAGDVIGISYSSNDMDPVVELHLGGQQIAYNDDGGVGLDSWIRNFVLPESGTYTIHAREFGNNDSGTYTLTLSEGYDSTILFYTLGAPEEVGNFIENEGDVHLYPLALGEATDLQIDLTSTDFDTYLRVYVGEALEDHDMSNLLASNDDGGEGLNSRLELSLDAGSYLIEARPLGSSSTGSYTLAISTGDYPEIYYGASLFESIDAAGDIDLYQFRGDAGDIVSIALTSTDMDPVLELHFGDQQVAFDDDGGNGTNSLISNFVLPSSGTYTIHAREFGNDGTGTYTLSLEEGEVLLVGAFDGAAAGELSGPGEIHLYTLSMASRQDVTLNLESPDFDTYLTLYAGDGIEDRTYEHYVDSDDDGGIGLNSQLVTTLEAGDYLVEVRGFDRSDTGRYTLTLGDVIDCGDEELFEIGDLVMVASGVGEPYYGWGSVSPGEVGIVVGFELFDGACAMIVDFPSQSGWYAAQSEMVFGTAYTVRARVGSTELTSPAQVGVGRSVVFEVVAADGSLLSDVVVEAPATLGRVSGTRLRTTERAGVTGTVTIRYLDEVETFLVETVPRSIERLIITPADVTLAPGERVDFDALGEDRFGNQFTPGGFAVGWHAVPAGCGEINSRTGVFTAGSVAGDCYVVAVVSRSLRFGDTGATVSGSGKVVVTSGLPESFALAQNRPNPFNPETQIRFELPTEAHVRLDIYNTAGQRITTLVEGMLPGGVHQYTWHAADQPTGIYLYRLSTDGFVDVRKMMLVR